MSKKRRWIAVGMSVVLLGLVAGVIILWKPQGPRAVEGPPALPPALSAAPAPAAAPEVPSSRDTSASKPTANGPKVTMGDTELIDVCGLGTVSVRRDDWNATAAVLSTATQATAKRWLSALMNSDDLRARAVGLLLDGKIGNDTLGVHPMSGETRYALVQLAAGAGDPAVYAAALTACHWGALAGGGDCQQVSVEGWAALDNNNAVPWLVLAGQARRRGDAAGEAAAMARASQATRVNSYNDSFDAFAAPLMPEDATPLDESVLTQQLSGTATALGPPYAGAALQFCSVVALQGGQGVRDRCNSLAELFVSHAQSIIDLDIGRALGERLGWPADRVRDLRQLSDAIQEVEREAVPQDFGASWSCDGVSRINALMRDRRQLGELAAGRRAVAKSGESVVELARQQQEFLDGLRRQASRQEQ